MTDDTDEVVERLEQCQLTLSVKFEVLSKSTLAEVAEKGCKLLHLMPQIFIADGGMSISQRLYVENEKLEAEELTDKKIKKIMRSKDSKDETVDLYLVILDLLDQEKKFCGAFLQRGARIVVAFRMKDQS